jgi:general secretion pathway protein G
VLEIPPAHSGGARRAQRAFSLIELFTAIAILGLAAAIAIPSYNGYLRRMKITAATQDIGRISMAIAHYQSINNALPPDLTTIGFGARLDPWGHPYEYLSFAGLKGKGKMRKDKSLVPINTQFDLYSVGPDGQSRPPLTAAVSRDDVIMANDGAYIGPAASY